MMSLLAFLGRALDKSVLSTQNHERHADTQSKHDGAMGAIGWTMLSLMLVLVLVLATWLRGTHPSPGLFYLPGSPDRKPALQSATFSPRMSTERVRKWSARSMMSVYSFNFINADQAIAATRPLFREDAYALFVKDISRKDGILTEVKAKKLEATLTPVSEVAVLYDGGYDDVRVWTMEFDALLSFTGSTKEENPSRMIKIKLLIEEAPTSQSISGLAIASIKITNTSN